MNIIIHASLNKSLTNKKERNVRNSHMKERLYDFYSFFTYVKLSIVDIFNISRAKM